jgi:prepilin-type N-terminal cleavage/methylation domain-containing protein
MPHLKSRRSDRGFSFVELLVVMAILAAVSLVGIPWFLKISQRNALKSAAREVQTTLLAARIKAVKRNRPVNVLITSLGPPVELQTVEPNPPAPTPTHVPVNLTLPAQAARLYETPNAAGGTVTFGGDGRLVNPPLNPTPGFGLAYTLEGPVGAPTPNRIRINADPSGRVTVITPVNWY